MALLPVVFQWLPVTRHDPDGTAIQINAMVPKPRYRPLARKQYMVGADYPLIPDIERNMRRHGGYFAELNEAYKQLPEDVAARWPSAEHFRKWVLVEVGFFHEKEFEMPSRVAARSLGKFLREEDEYARIFVRNNKVIIQRAKSQSLSAMGPQEFYASCKAVLEYAASMIGITVDDLKQNTGRAA